MLSSPPPSSSASSLSLSASSLAYPSLPSPSSSLPSSSTSSSPSPSASSASSSSSSSSSSFSLSSLSSLIPVSLISGGVAGCVARSVVAPIDRVKILMQTQRFTQPQQQVQAQAQAQAQAHAQVLQFNGTTQSASATIVANPQRKYKTTLQSLSTIYKEEGILSLWRGNLTNLVRVLPYSASQFAFYDIAKSSLLRNKKGDTKLNHAERLLSGSFAAVMATSLTHPLDVIRLRLSVTDARSLSGFRAAATSVWQEGGMRTMFKGYTATVLSVAPFISINFASFDALKTWVASSASSSYLSPSLATHPLCTLGMGAAAGIFAQTLCYPLDTVRRRMQLRGTIYTSTAAAFACIVRDEGVKGFYVGMLPNVIKVVPNNAIRFQVYEWLIKTFGGDKNNKNNKNNNKIQENRRKD